MNCKDAKCPIKTASKGDIDQIKLKEFINKMTTLVIVSATLAVVYITFKIPYTVVYYYIIISIYRNIEANFHVIQLLLYVIPLFTLLPPILPLLYKLKILNNKLISLFMNYSIKSIQKFLKIFLILIAVLFLLEFLLPTILLHPVEQDVAKFIESTQTCRGDIKCVISAVTHYVDINVRSSYGKPQSILEIDNVLTQADYMIIHALGFSRPHVILWQGWGSCGQRAIVTAYLLHRLGYDVRLAKFTDVDHMWAEVLINGTWYIVDPWYIGQRYEDRYLIPASILASLSGFRGNHGVLCTYLNETEVDCTNDHGYRP